jgi:hypothetical protein
MALAGLQQTVCQAGGFAAGEALLTVESGLGRRSREWESTGRGTVPSDQLRTPRIPESDRVWVAGIQPTYQVGWPPL